MMSHGQNIPNGDFESWFMRDGTLQPDSWTTDNNPLWVTVNQYSPGYNSSNYAAMLSVVNYLGGNYKGLMSQKFAYNQRPAGVIGAYKLLPQSGDFVNLVISIALTKNMLPVGVIEYIKGSAE